MQEWWSHMIIGKCSLEMDSVHVFLVSSPDEQQYRQM